MKKIMEQTTAPTEKQIQTILKSDQSKSKKMIALFELGLEVKVIAEHMSQMDGKLVRYNFVYNVVSNHCNVNGIKMEGKEKEGKKENIIAMFLDGKTNKEISIALKANSNYVFNTIKAYKLANPTAVTHTQPEAQAE